MNGRTIGREYTPEKLVDILLKDRVFYEQSAGGVTFSGGEPMEQADFLGGALGLCKEYGIHTAVDTCGYAGRTAINRIMHLTDLFLFDLKLMDPAGHFYYTSVDNTTILDNLEYLLENEKKVIVRVPLIPGITVTEFNISEMTEYLGKFDPIPEINLLPYHRTAEGKYERMNLVNRMIGSRTLTDEEIIRSLEIFRSAGLPAELG